MFTKKVIVTLASSLILVQTGFSDDSPLAKEMEVMNDAYKAMRRETDSVKGADLARQAQDSMVKAFLEVPEMVKAMPDGPEKAKATASYRKMMATTIGTFADMELAFLENDLAKVKILVETLREQKSKGHDKFMEE